VQSPDFAVVELRNGIRIEYTSVGCLSLISKKELVGKGRVYGFLTGGSQKIKNQFGPITAVAKNNPETSERTYPELLVLCQYFVFFRMH
jgi:hypothetical protein